MKIDKLTRTRISLYLNMLSCLYTNVAQKVHNWDKSFAIRASRCLVCPIKSCLGILFVSAITHLKLMFVVSQNLNIGQSSVKNDGF